MNEVVIRELLRRVTKLEGDLARVETLRALFEVHNFNPTLQSLSANQNNYSVGNYDAVYLSPTIAIDITGFTGGVLGRGLLIRNSGSVTITLVANSALSTQGNRIITFTGANYSLTTGMGVYLFYGKQATGQPNWFILLTA